MDWGLFVCLSPIFILAGIGIFSMLWDKYFNPYLENYRSFNSPNNHWRSSKAVVKLTYKQLCDFAAIKPEAFCVEDGYLYEVSKTGVANYTKIHLNLLDYLKFVNSYTRMRRHKRKVAVNKKASDDMSAFLLRMQDNIQEYRKMIERECAAEKEKLRDVAENMINNNKQFLSRAKNALYYRGIYPSTPFVRCVGDLYMSKDGKMMYVVDKELHIQKWDADKLLAYISKEGMDGEAAFDFVTSSVGQEKLKYKFRGDVLTKIIPQMKPGDIYYNPVLKKYMVMEESGNMNYLTTDDFVDRFGGINSCLNV
jgi:hypothetical protein